MRYRSPVSIQPWGVGPPASRRVTRAPRYSGSASAFSSLRLRGSYPLRPTCPGRFDCKVKVPFSAALNPSPFGSVWAPPRSLAATWGIDVSFFSSGYLDVSVPRVPSVTLILFGVRYPRIAAGEFPHSEICGSKDVCSSPQLIAACRVLLRLPVPRRPPYAFLRLTFFGPSLRRVTKGEPSFGPPSPLSEARPRSFVSRFEIVNYPLASLLAPASQASREPSPPLRLPSRAQVGNTSFLSP